MHYNELYHHGILGMKWGIRRYQPYPSGHKGGKEIGEAAKVKQRDKRIKKSRKDAAKRRRTMSNKELENRVKRLENEKKLKELTERDVSPGKAATKDILKKAGKAAAITLATGVLVYAGAQVLKKNGIDLKDAAEIANAFKPPKEIKVKIGRDKGQIAEKIGQKIGKKGVDAVKAATKGASEAVKDASDSAIKLEFGQNLTKDSTPSKSLSKISELTKASKAQMESNKKAIAEAEKLTQDLLSRNKKLIKKGTQSSAVKNGVYNPNIENVNEWYDQFKWKRLERVTKDGKASHVDVPTDIEFFKDKYAEWNSKGNPKEYDYWYKTITDAFANMGIHNERKK